MTTTAPITFIKLRSGSWGVRGPASAIVEDASVTVAKRSGETSHVTIDRVLWTDGAAAIAAIEDTHSRPRTYNAFGERVSGSRCRCSHPLDEGDGECMKCGYRIF